MRYLTFSISILFSSVLYAATRPEPPVILEPAVDFQVVNAEDVHMATASMQDADGDRHLCSDFGIRDLHTIIWHVDCVTGPSKVHVHLGDGQYTEGRTRLATGSGYWLRVRHRDDSGDPETEWSQWSERFFNTANATPIPPFTLHAVTDSPTPRWVSTAGEPIMPPFDARFRLELVDGAALLELGRAGDQLATLSSRRVAESAALRAVFQTGSEEWVLPESDLTLHDADGNERTLYFPERTIPPGERVLFWMSENGSSHEAEAEDRVPDFSKISRGAPIPWRVLQPGFRVEKVATDLELPVNIAFVPNPREEPDAPLFYVTELYGNIKVVLRNNEVRDYATKLLDFDPQGPLPGAGEIGVTGITVEPETGDLIVAMLYLAHPGQSTIYPRVARFHSEDGGYTAAEVDTILDLPGEVQAASHQISNVSIGPDGYLYVHVGDSHVFEIAQNLDTVRGKIIRFGFDGLPPVSNPFYDKSDGITAADYIYALGFRNPFGGAWRADDGMLYEVENGPSLDRLVQVVRGRNYLWDGTDESMKNYAICNFHGGTAPVNLAFVQAETFDGSEFPESKLGHLFVSESGPTWSTGPQRYGKRIEEIVLKPDGTLESGPTPLIEYNGTGKATVAGIEAGPEGLYFTGLYKDFGWDMPLDRGADIFRVRWVGLANFGFGVTDNPLSVAFIDRSAVPDANHWLWDFGDGTTTDERHPLHVYSREGTYVIRLAVTGPRGTVTHVSKVDVGRSGSGLVAEYYRSTEQTGVRKTAGETSIDFAWQKPPITTLPSGEFSARWTGRIRARYSETYHFSLDTDDADARLLIDGAVLLDADHPEGEIALEAGQLHNFVVEYTHRAGPAFIHLQWESENQPREIVPPSAFAPPAESRRRRSAP